MLEIESLEERKQLKEVLGHVFKNLYQHVEEEYEALEKRILNELTFDRRKIAITTGLIKKSYYDPTDTSLVPMRESDLEDKVITMEDILLSLEEKIPFYLYTIFMELDYLVIKELRRTERRFSGIVKTTKGEHKATFTIKANTSYLQMIEQLYHIVNNNYLPWHTVCCSYLHKLFDVYICSIENWDSEGDVEEVRINFEEYASLVHYDCIPLWNIRKVVEKTSSYPEPCMDKVEYEHTIYKYKLDEDASYLVATADIPISNIRSLGGDLVITCKEANPNKWLLYRLGATLSDHNTYQPMTNAIEDNFTDYLFDRYKNTIKTKTELERLIHAIGYKDYLDFAGIEWVDKEIYDQETYNMDYFIEDEIRVGKPHKSLVLKFKPQKQDHYLNRDIMSYIVTHVQHIFPEYHCIGRLV